MTTTTNPEASAFLALMTASRVREEAFAAYDATRPGTAARDEAAKRWDDAATAYTLALDGYEASWAPARMVGSREVVTPEAAERMERMANTQDWRAAKAA